MALTRIKLAEILGEKSGIAAKQSAKMTDQVSRIMRDTLERGEKIKIPGFWIFTVREKATRKGWNPKTGERMQISPRRVLPFKPSGVLRKTLDRGGI
jgi:integration host factor subunit alpha